MPDLRLPRFRIIHAAYVASDLEAGRRRLEAMFAPRAFNDFRGIPIEVPGGEAIIDFVVADMGGWAFEVICPAGGEDHVYRELLPADPTDIAFHHFATRIKNEAEWDMVVEAAESHGLDVPVLGHAEQGTSYIYLDTRAQLGHMLEFIWDRAD
jgi:hypothetical protein